MSKRTDSLIAAAFKRGDDIHKIALSRKMHPKNVERALRRFMRSGEVLKIEREGA